MVDLSDGVDPADVRDIVDNVTADDNTLDFWIDAAEDLIDDRVDTAVVTGDTYDRIHLLVSAHMVAAQSPTTESESGPTVEVDYEGTRDPDPSTADLTETRYGRRAISLDPTGALAEAGDPFVFETYGT